MGKVTSISLSPTLYQHSSLEFSVLKHCCLAVSSNYRGHSNGLKSNNTHVHNLLSVKSADREVTLPAALDTRQRKLPLSDRETIGTVNVPLTITYPLFLESAFPSPSIQVQVNLSPLATTVNVALVPGATLSISRGSSMIMGGSTAEDEEREGEWNKGGGGDVYYNARWYN